MSCFKLPQSIFKALNNVTTKFWWGQKSKDRKFIGLAGNPYVNQKRMGGMGFRDMECFNRVYCMVYFQNGDFVNAQLGNQPSNA